jgi:predicted DsbA family dithiol-disulfide isomerase
LQSLPELKQPISLVVWSRNKAKVEASIQEGVAAGAQGTPYSIVIVGDQQAVINGAQPYPVVKQTIENLINQLEGEEAKPAA